MGVIVVGGDVEPPFELAESATKVGKGLGWQCFEGGGVAGSPLLSAMLRRDRDGGVVGDVEVPVGVRSEFLNDVGGASKSVDF